MLCTIATAILSALFKNDGCRDEGICVFSADPQSVLAFVIVVGWRNLRFQCGSACLFGHSDGCSDGGLCVLSGHSYCCREGGYCLVSADPLVFLE